MSVNAQNLVRGEYWIDLDNGWGNATPFVLDADNETADLALPLDLTGYEPGTHILGLRTLDDDGKWSITNTKPIVVIASPTTPDVVRTDYYLNNDPGFSQGGQAWAGSTADLSAQNFTPDLAGAVNGVNTLFIRTLDADGRWSVTNHMPVTLIPLPERGVIDREETFALSTQDPGFGGADGHLFSVPDEQLADSLFNAPVPLTFQLGDTLMIRTHESRGIWSLTNYIQTETSTSTSELENKAGISVGPNPFTQTVSVDPHGAPVRAVLYDPQGRLVYDRLLSGTTIIDMASHSAGAYTAFFWKDRTLLHRIALIKQ